MRQLWKFVERFFNVKALWTSENLELLRIYDKVVAGKLPQESFQVEATLLQEYQIFVAHGLFRWNKRQDNARPSLGQSIMQKIELIIASLAIPLTLQIDTLDNIDDMASEVLWVTHRKLCGSLV